MGRSWTNRPVPCLSCNSVARWKSRRPLFPGRTMSMISWRISLSRRQERSSSLGLPKAWGLPSPSDQNQVVDYNLLSRGGRRETLKMFNHVFHRRRNCRQMRPLHRGGAGRRGNADGGHGAHAHHRGRQRASRANTWFGTRCGFRRGQPKTVDFRRTGGQVPRNGRADAEIRG